MQILNITVFLNLIVSILLRSKLIIFHSNYSESTYRKGKIQHSDYVCTHIQYAVFLVINNYATAQVNIKSMYSAETILDSLTFTSVRTK